MGVILVFLLGIGVPVAGWVYGALLALDKKESKFFVGSLPANAAVTFLGTAVILWTWRHAGLARQYGEISQPLRLFLRDSWSLFLVVGACIVLAGFLLMRRIEGRRTVQVPFPSSAQAVGSAVYALIALQAVGSLAICAFVVGLVLQFHR